MKCSAMKIFDHVLTTRNSKSWVFIVFTWIDVWKNPNSYRPNLLNNSSYFCVLFSPVYIFLSNFSILSQLSWLETPSQVQIDVNVLQAEISGWGGHLMTFQLTCVGIKGSLCQGRKRIFSVLHWHVPIFEMR